MRARKSLREIKALSGRVYAYADDFALRGEPLPVADDRTLLIPDRKGNKLAFGFRNILETRRIGLLFLVPRVRETLRVNGSAEITRDPALLEPETFRNPTAHFASIRSPAIRAIFESSH